MNHKKFSLFYFLIFFSFHLILSSEKIVWSKLNSPHLIEKEVIITDDQILEVESGSTIELKKNGMLIIQGKLVLQGEPTDSIYVCFEKDTGILIENNANAFISHAHFESDQTNFSSQPMLDIKAKASVQLISSTFDEHYSKYGSAIRISNAKLKISFCEFSNFVSSQKAGVISADHSNIEITNSIFFNNSSSLLGGALALSDCICSFESSLLHSNKSNLGGFIFAQQNSEINIQNCTIFGNLAAKGAVACLSNYSSVSFLNSILWLNTSGFGSISHAMNETCKTSCQYCCFDDSLDAISGQKDITPVVSNIHKNPQFLLYSRYPFSLKESSPCINVGKKKVFFLSDKDLISQNRVLENRVDIGAYEWNPENKQKQMLDSYEIFYYSGDGNVHLSYQLSEKSDVTIQIFNSKGYLLSEIDKQDQNIGEYNFKWDGIDFKKNQQKKVITSIKFLLKNIKI